jgi:hypothetical protein
MDLTLGQYVVLSIVFVGAIIACAWLEEWERKHRGADDGSGGSGS